MTPPTSQPGSSIVTRRLENGATLVVEPIDNVASVALNWLVPAGVAADPPGADGTASMLAEMIFRGAGALDSRAHSDALDRLGVQRAAEALGSHLQLSATLLGDRLDDALPLLTALICSPQLPDDAIDAVRSLCLQTLEGLEDDPQHLVMLRLRERHVPPPFGRHGYGTVESLNRLTAEDIRRAWAARFRPEGTIISAAGAVDVDALAGRLNALHDGWTGAAAEPVSEGTPPRGTLHLERDTAQVHIGVAFDAPREADPDATLQRLSVAVLSGSTSGRLFTEVRQKRSLCYSVGASYRSSRDYGLVSMYAGTTPERAQETLDVSVAEIERLYGNEGVTREEFDRAVIGLKSHIIMQGESTPARAAAIAHDTWRLGRARSLDELAGQIESISLDRLNAYCAERSPGPYTVVSIGSAPLTVDDRLHAVS